MRTGADMAAPETFRKLHRHAERNQFELAFLQRDLFCGTQINPIRFAVNVCQFFYFVRKIFNLDRFCFHAFCLPSEYIRLHLIRTIQHRPRRIFLLQALLHIE